MIKPLQYTCLLSILSEREVSFSLTETDLIKNWMSIVSQHANWAQQDVSSEIFPQLRKSNVHLIFVAICLITFGRIILADSIIPDMHLVSKLNQIILSAVIMVSVLTDMAS